MKQGAKLRHHSFLCPLSRVVLGIGIVLLFIRGGSGDGVGVAVVVPLVAVEVAGDAEVAGCEAVGVHYSRVCSGHEVGVALLTKQRGARVQDDGIGHQRPRTHAKLVYHLWRRQHRATVRTHRPGALWRGHGRRIIFLECIT